MLFWIFIQNVLYSFAMARTPKARKQILDAARRIVETRGAGHLTFEELAAESRVTRGGITYHFPTKEALLKALIEADIAGWNAAAEELGSDAGLPCPKACRMIGLLRSSLAGEDDAHRRFVSGMLSAAMVDPGLLDPVRAHLAAEFADWRWDDADLERYLLLLAADGLFWNQLFDVSPLPAAVRPRLAALIEAKVRAFAAEANVLAPLPPHASGAQASEAASPAASATSHSDPTSES
jgi:AcrR family transcriptional regulator